VPFAFSRRSTEFDTFDFSKSDIVVDDITEEEFNDAQILMSVSIRLIVLLCV
jgi:hypothetical protein